MKRIRSLVVILCVLLLPVMGRRWASCDAAVPEATSPPNGRTVSSRAANPAKAAPGDARPGPSSARSICYGWKPGHSYTYRVKANTQLTDFEEDLDGTVVYTVKSIDSDGVAHVTCIENFSHSRKSRSTSDLASTAEAGHSSSFEHQSNREEITTVNSAPERIAIDRHGRIADMEAGGTPPFPVGRISRLAIEPLSSVNENAWTISGDVRIVLAQKAEMFPTPPTGSEGEALAAHEKTTYTIKGSDSTSILVSKTYGFTSNAEVNGKPRLAMTGEGELTFDRQNGVFKSSTMEMHVTLYENGNPLKLASMVNCALIRIAAEPNKAP